VWGHANSRINKTKHKNKNGAHSSPAAQSAVAKNGRRCPDGWSAVGLGRRWPRVAGS
jgi:hypothetical protein